ncbi:dihydrodipicolinate synthase family protein, partial [candidate division KSB1 bacterium]|nr:dihydrodipicolinate synthase family protein [candidate division KSB1 bacterium]
NLMDLGDCLTFRDGRYDILFGRDEMLLAGLAIGVKGAIGTFYNFAAPVFNRLIDAFQNGDLAQAQKMQEIARRIVAVFFRHQGSLGAAKEMMRLTGIDCGPVRLPLRSLDTQTAQALETELRQSGLLEYWMCLES